MDVQDGTNAVPDPYRLCRSDVLNPWEKKMRVTFPLILSFALIIGPAAYAAGSDGSSGGSSTPTCKSGYVWDKKKKKCVHKNAQIFPDSDLTEQAWALARKGEFEAGRILFNAVAN